MMGTVGRFRCGATDRSAACEVGVNSPFAMSPFACTARKPGWMPNKLFKGAQNVLRQLFCGAGRGSGKVVIICSPYKFLASSWWTVVSTSQCRQFRFQHAHTRL